MGLGGVSGRAFGFIVVELSLTLGLNAVRRRDSPRTAAGVAIGTAPTPWHGEREQQQRNHDGATIHARRIQFLKEASNTGSWL
jgi:hypothetical protein